MLIVNFILFFLIFKFKLSKQLQTSKISCDSLLFIVQQFFTIIIILLKILSIYVAGLNQVEGHMEIKPIKHLQEARALHRTSL
jgi:heme/copper-type cytochrome/quinol oxidase subunit 2